MGERIAYLNGFSLHRSWVQDRWVRCTFYRASDWLLPYQHHEVERSLPWCVWMVGGGIPDRKLCIPVWRSTSGRLFVCMPILWRGGTCHVLCLWHGISVKVPLLQAGTVAILLHMFKSDVKPKTNKRITAIQARFNEFRDNKGGSVLTCLFA